MSGLHQTAELEENCARFFTRALSGGMVWAVTHDGGFITCVANDGEHAIIPFWSDAAYARRAAKAERGDEFVVESFPLDRFLEELLGGFQHDDLLIGPNYTQDMAGLELDPREVFEELRSRMTDEQRATQAHALANASILTIGHPPEKLERRIDIFACVAAEEGQAWTLMENGSPLHVDVRARPGTSFVPLWCLHAAAERARRFAFAPERNIAVECVLIERFLESAQHEGWLVGADPTIGFACSELEPRHLLERVARARAALRAEPPSDE